MDRYGYVSNNYQGHAMGGQARVMHGGGGGQHYHKHQTHMPATQVLHKNGGGPVMTQPMSQDYKNEVKKMVFSKDGREWTTGLCGCFEHCASCLGAFCCMPCFACYVAMEMDENVCGAFCCSSFIALRTRLRGVLGIEGSVCKDLCALWLCPCCALSQMYREIQNSTE